VTSEHIQTSDDIYNLLTNKVNSWRLWSFSRWLCAEFFDADDSFSYMVIFKAICLLKESSLTNLEQVVS